MKPRKASRNIRAAIAFGDIIGSSTWLQRVNNQGLEYRSLMDRFDDAVYELAKKDTCYVKKLGDGFMKILNIDHASSLEISDFLILLWNFNKKIQGWINEHPNPRPDGFRIRMACGYIEEKLHTDNSIDYRGYHLALTSKLLRVEKNIPFITHASVKEILTNSHIKRFKFKFEKLRKPKLSLDGIFEKDMEELWSFRVEGK